MIEIHGALSIWKPLWWFRAVMSSVHNGYLHEISRLALVVYARSENDIFDIFSN